MLPLPSNIMVEKVVRIGPLPISDATDRVAHCGFQVIDLATRAKASPTREPDEVPSACVTQSRDHHHLCAAQAGAFANWAAGE
ncbi:MAG: hypothetical protein K0S66_3045 [Sphingomonas sp.]|jgi:hypothetical protein|nr:hypothetical protein [Sphingomonas sp.]